MAPARGSVMTKVQRLIDEITAKVRSGEWPPGHQLPLDREIRAWHGDSQMTVRTAFERLRDIIESAPGKGRFVRHRD